MKNTQVKKSVGASAFRRLRAFTLIELLVVISIISILAAMLLPALSAAKAKAIRIKCLNNIKQCALAMVSFGIDNHDTIPNAGGGGGGSWPWDVNAVNENDLVKNGMTRDVQYDPGYVNQNVDQMWNYGVAYASGAGADTNQAISGNRATGYAWTLIGNIVVSDDQNSSLATQVMTLAGNDPALTATIPAAGGLLRIDNSRRVIVSDAVFSAATQTDPTQIANYQWVKNTASGLTTWITVWGRWQGSSTSHTTKLGIPTGANEGCLDGHAKWYPWATTFNVHTPVTGTPAFWWLSDPAKL